LCSDIWKSTLSAVGLDQHDPVTHYLKRANHRLRKFYLSTGFEDYDRQEEPEVIEELQARDGSNLDVGC